MSIHLYNSKYTSFRLAMILLAIMFSMLACKKDRCLKSAGKITTEERALDDFGKIILSDDINLFIQQDSINSVEVEAGENLIPWIVTKVENGVLTIRNDNKCNWLRTYKKKINLYLHCRNLFMIDYDGAGDIKGLNTLVTDSLEMNFWDGSGCITLDLQCRMVRVHMHTGPGDAELTGTTQSALYYNRANGMLRCSGLKADYVYIDSQCTNDSYVYSNAELDARIAYIGNVYYSGHPPVVKAEVTERGQLIPLD